MLKISLILPLIRPDVLLVRHDAMDTENVKFSFLMIQL